jgi:hypothetical protein
MPFAHELQLLAAKELREGFCQELNGLLRASAPLPEANHIVAHDPGEFLGRNTNELGNSVQIIPMRKSHPECLDLLEEHEGELSSSEFATPLGYQQWIFGLQPAVSRGPPPSRPMGL